MNHSYSVLFLEDEPTIRDVLTEYMSLSGYQVTAVADGDQAIGLLRTQTFHIAVLDIMVPGASGFDVLQFIQQHSPDTAVIMLTALEDETSQVKAFNLYADDYIIKPVSPIILLKRMETILRRTASRPASAEAPQSGLSLKEESYSAYYHGEKLPLTLSEYLLLHTLYQSPQRVFTREQLLDQIWGYEYAGDTRTVDVHIKRLREKIKDHASWKISTIWGIGYKFEVKS